MTMQNKTRRLTLMAMFTALAYIVMSVGRIPISSVDFLKYDPKDTILAIGGFILGPAPALLISFTVALIEMLTVSTTGLIGFLMNVISSVLFVCPAAALYRRRHSLRGAIAGLVIGVALSTCAMLLWNYCITPIYMGYPRQAVAEMLLPVFLPFNLIKGSVNAAITVLIYKPVSRALKKAGLMEAHSNDAARRENAQLASIGAAVLLVSCLIAILAIRGIL